MSWRTGKVLLGWDSSSWMLDFVAWTLTPGSMRHIAVLQWDCSTTRLTLLAKSLSAEPHSVLATRTWGKEFWKQGVYIGKGKLKRARSSPRATPHHTHTAFPEKHKQLDHNLTHTYQDQEDRDIKRWTGMEGKAFAKWTTFTTVVGKMAVRWKMQPNT